MPETYYEYYFSISVSECKHLEMEYLRYIDDQLSLSNSGSSSAGIFLILVEDVVVGIH